MTNLWADRYIKIKRTAEDAIRLIKPGNRVFVGSPGGIPRHLVRELFKATRKLTDVEIISLLSPESAPFGFVADKTLDQIFNLKSFYPGSLQHEALRKKTRFITPINLSAIPNLLKSRAIPVHVALVQVSPPDDFGWMSLGIAVDISLAAVQSAELVIAQVNAEMPRVLGWCSVHVNEVDMVVEHDERLLSITVPPEPESAAMIAGHTARLVDDGATIQVGLGALHRAIVTGLSEKNDLGIHTRFLTDEIMHLFSTGVITNRQKGYKEGKLVASNALGSQELYTFVDDNPAVEFHPSGYINDQNIISQHSRMTAINFATTIDLTGQVAADTDPLHLFSGVTGMLDFMRGATQSKGGKAITVIPATSEDSSTSNIVPLLEKIPVVVPRSDIHHVVTEYGAVNLLGKSIQERALALISIAHPEFRDQLFSEAKAIGFLGNDRVFKDSIKGIYPLKLEETVIINDESVTIRPAKPVDTRRIQEFFYEMGRDDIVSRFFQEKKMFVRDEIEGRTQIDYIKDLSIVAIVGEFGFGKVIGVGEYFLIPRENIAEIAFTVRKAYQGKGLGKILLRKLVRAARENGIAGLVALTYPQNKRMTQLFNSLPYKSHTATEDDMISLSCRFDDPKL
jgi:acyl-CoA hydrolase/GNAT superfamily N-acetyltransferase